MRQSRRELAAGAAIILAAALLALPAGGQQAGGKKVPANNSSVEKPAARDGGYAQRFASVCAACHGANGRTDTPGMPVLAGQPSFYAITQLFLFREGRRGNPAMSAIAKPMTDADLRGFSDFIGTLPPVPAPASAKPSDATLMSRGAVLAKRHKCIFCHGADLSGGQQVPRIGGQREDYLLMALQGFKTGTRSGYSQAMTEALSQVPPEDLSALAYYVARFPGALAKSGE